MLFNTQLSQGTVMLREAIDIMQRNVPDQAARLQIYMRMIRMFREQKLETERMLAGFDPAYDEAMRLMAGRGL